MNEVKFFKIKKGDIEKTALCIKTAASWNIENTILKRAGYSLEYPYYIFHPIGEETDATYDIHKWKTAIDYESHRQVIENWDKSIINIFDFSIKQINFDVELKFLQVRDRGTHMPTIAFKIKDPLENFSDYINEDDIYVNFIGVDKANFKYDQWDNQIDRTRHYAHRHIQENWKGIANGDVIDVEYILGESSFKKKFEF